MDAIEAVLAETTPQGVVNAVEPFASALGVRSLGFARAFEEGRPTGWGNARSGWRQRYIDEGLCLSDPGYRRATRPRETMVMRFDRGFPGLEKDRGIMAFCEELRAHGGTASMMVPDTSVRGRAEMWSVTFGTDIAERSVGRWQREEGRRLELMARVVLGRMHRLLDDAGEREGLTRRERQVLELLAEGHQYARIAGILGVSDKTVEFHAANLRQRLKARTTHEALAKAIRRGML
jgi:LuxR family quorum-sensing transcriptional regulator LasR